MEELLYKLKYEELRLIDVYLNDIADELLLRGLSSDELWEYMRTCGIKWETLKKFPSETIRLLRSKIYKKSIPFVKWLTTKWSKGDRWDDFFQEASIGLLRALDKYDVEKGVNFTTYAYHWMAASLQRHIATTNLIHYTRKAGSRVAKLAAIEDEIIPLLERQPTAKELSNIIGLSEEEVEEALASAKQLLSLDAQNTDNGLTPLETLPSQDAQQDTLLEAEKLTEALNKALNNLSCVEEFALRAIYYQDLSMNEAAAKLQISRQALWGIVKRALENIRREECVRMLDYK